VGGVRAAIEPKPRWRRGNVKLTVYRCSQMSYAKITRDQFELARNEVKHKPTNASFVSYPGLNKVVCSVTWGRCGFVLDSGESYSRDEVEAFAKELMKTARVDTSAPI
jgi:hypothetical protein